MSPAAKLLRLIAVELESKALMEEMSDKIGNKEIGVLADENESTVGAWLRDESSNRQFSALLTLCSYLPVATITEIFGKILPDKPRSIKQALDENTRSEKAKRKKLPKKKAPALVPFIGDKAKIA